MTFKRAFKRTENRMFPSKGSSVINMTLHGVDFHVFTKNQLEQYEHSLGELLPLGGQKYLSLMNKSRGNLYRAAGYNENKIDFAVPQSWLELPENRTRFYGGDRAVWSYEGKGYGKPIWDSEMKARLKRQVNARLKKRVGR